MKKHNELITLPNQTNLNKLPWVEKYRPHEINKIISHKEIIRSLKNFIKMMTLPHLLFFGPSGSGKTSTIMCCANEIYGKYVNCMVLQLNASNERGIETVRTKIKNFVSNRNNIFLPIDMRNIFKLVILDEIDSMTVEAQGMLRQIIEKNSNTTRFCLICNEIDKINIALQSRCAMFRFPPLNMNDMKEKLLSICEIENIKYDTKSIDAIIKISRGDMRSAINTLQYINLTLDDKMTLDNIYKVSGHCMPKINNDIFNILISLSNKKINLIECVNKIYDIIIDNNITMFNLLDELKNIVILSNMRRNKKIYLIDIFAKNEIYDSVNVDLKIIIMIISSSFIIVNNIK